MKVTRVQYSVDQKFVDQNKKNIAAVMKELRSLKRNDVKYAAYLLEDGVTFMHLVHCASEEAEDVLTSLKSFEVFQEQVSDHFVNSPKVEHPTVVASSFDFFV